MNAPMRVIRFVSISCAILSLLAQLIIAQTTGKPKKLSPKQLTRELQNEKAEIFYGGTMIASGQTLRGRIIVVEGSLDIQDGGVLEGDVWMINASLVITGTGRVTGHVKLVNSDIYAAHQAEVSGGVSYYRCECRIDADTFEDTGELVFVKEEDPLAIKTKLAVAAGKPTRVRYDVLRLGVKHGNDLRRDPHTRWQVMVSIPLYFDTQRGYLEFDADTRIPLGSNRYKLLLGGFKKLHSEDWWQVSRTENALLLVLTANEFANYYERRGAEIGFEWQPQHFVTVDLVALFHEDVSMRKSDVFTIFGSEDNLPENPPIEEGARAALRAGVTFDSREERDYPRDAWFLGLWIEPGRLSPSATGSEDLDYTAFTVEANRYTRLPFAMQWDIGTRLSSSFDRIPQQLFQTLNGYGGIRGTDDAPFPVIRGDRMVRLSTELRTELPELPVISWFYSRWDLLLFADAGYLTEAKNPTSVFGFLDASWDDWKKSVGVGISGESLGPYVGLYIAREIAGDRDRPRFIVRLERSF
jgi:hypothetical protein